MYVLLVHTTTSWEKNAQHSHTQSSGFRAPPPVVPLTCHSEALMEPHWDHLICRIPHSQLFLVLLPMKLMRMCVLSGERVMGSGLAFGPPSNNKNSTASLEFSRWKRFGALHYDEGFQLWILEALKSFLQPEARSCGHYDHMLLPGFTRRDTIWINMIEGIL